MRVRVIVCAGGVHVGHTHLRFDVEFSLALTHSTLGSIGYEDRFDGVQEVGFDEFDTGNIPFHRIRYLKKQGEIVYDREKRIDKLFVHHKEKNVM